MPISSLPNPGEYESQKYYICSMIFLSASHPQRINHMLLYQWLFGRPVPAMSYFERPVGVYDPFSEKWVPLGSSSERSAQVRFATTSRIDRVSQCRSSHHEIVMTSDAHRRSSHHAHRRPPRQFGTPDRPPAVVGWLAVRVTVPPLRRWSNRIGPTSIGVRGGRTVCGVIR